ncbi:hypothetical protein IL972_09855 [Acinetobacter sp. FL51]|uniref:hypothetical protein n=1 Tax=Acinetobacter sp. FL51 TaxID=2777978 RepID=UPI0018E1C5C8|nr:hypothetical protein [Acinetobacter sp. FL51]MBI1452209.1 hypothetical protein [Acinetobacter sp. FL51]
MAKKNLIVGALTLGAIALTATNPAMADAIITGTEVTAAATGAGADESMKAGALWALGLTISAVVVAKVLGIVRK